MRCTEKTKRGTRCERSAKQGEKKCASHLGLAHRPTKLDAQVTSALTTAIRAGNYTETAARHAGIAPSTFYEWMQRGEQRDAKGEPVHPQFAEFREAVKKAEADAEAYAVGQVRLAMQDSWQAAMTYLERRHPERWGRRTVLEHTGPGGGAVEAKVDVTDERTRELAHELVARRAGRS
jgi:transposase-like protein